MSRLLFSALAILALTAAPGFAQTPPAADAPPPPAGNSTPAEPAPSVIAPAPMNDGSAATETPVADFSTMTCLELWLAYQKMTPMMSMVQRSRATAEISMARSSMATGNQAACRMHMLNVVTAR